MAELRINAGGVRVQVDMGELEKASDEFKAARKDINQRLKIGMRKAGEDVALPYARRAVAGLRIAGESVPASLTVRASSSRAVITSTLKPRLRRGFGWMEYGGANRGLLKPKSGKAVSTPWGPRAAVYRGNASAGGRGKPAVIKGGRRVETAIAKHQPQISDAVLKEVLQVFEGRRYIVTAKGGRPVSFEL